MFGGDRFGGTELGHPLNHGAEVGERFDLVGFAACRRRRGRRRRGQTLKIQFNTRRESPRQKRGRVAFYLAGVACNKRNSDRPSDRHPDRLALSLVSGRSPAPFGRGSMPKRPLFDDELHARSSSHQMSPKFPANTTLVWVALT